MDQDTLEAISLEAHSLWVIPKQRVIAELRHHNETLTQYSLESRMPPNLVLSILLLAHQGDLDDIPEVLPRQSNLAEPLRNLHAFLYRKDYKLAGSGANLKFDGKRKEKEEKPKKDTSTCFPQTGGQFGFRTNHKKGAYRYELIDSQKKKVEDSPILVVLIRRNDCDVSWGNSAALADGGGGGGEDAGAEDHDGPFNKRGRVRSIPVSYTVGIDIDSSKASTHNGYNSDEDDSSDGDDIDESFLLGPSSSLADSYSLPAGSVFSSMLSDLKKVPKKFERWSASSENSIVDTGSASSVADSICEGGGGGGGGENDLISQVLSAAALKALNFGDENVVFSAQRLPVHGPQSQGSPTPSSDLYGGSVSFMTSPSSCGDVSMQGIQESCQKKQWVLGFVNERKEGPDHNPVFFNYLCHQR